MLGKGITNYLQKLGLALHTAVLDVQEVCFTLVPDGAEKNYADTFKVLDDYFIPNSFIYFIPVIHCFGKLVSVVRKRSISLFVGSDNEPLCVSLGAER